MRIGDVTRPDDGVLGCFIEQEGIFAPVSRKAADNAVLNPLFESTASGSTTSRAVRHPFIGHASEFELAPGDTLDLVILDPRGDLFAACGVLPRKCIMLPRELLEPTLAKLEPSFRVGPVLTNRRADKVAPLLVGPAIEGLEATFVYEQQPASEEEQPSFPTAALPLVPPLAELPTTRVTLDQAGCASPCAASDMRRRTPPAARTTRLRQTSRLR